MASAVARAYNGALGAELNPVDYRLCGLMQERVYKSAASMAEPLVRGSGAKPLNLKAFRLLEV